MSGKNMDELLDQDSVREFVEEAREHIVLLNRDLLELEERGSDAPAEMVNSVFRAIHTVKGNSGMLGLDAINGLSHKMEDALSNVRKGEAVVSGELASALFESLDFLSEMVEALAAGDSPEGDVSGAIAGLDAALVGGRSKGKPEAAGSAKNKDKLGSDRPEERPDARPAAASQVIRVDVDRLDRILALVGELVILRSRYDHVTGQAIAGLARTMAASREVIELQSEFNEVESSMSRTLSELQDSVMKARMVPLGTVFGRFHRAVRDLAAASGKRIRFESSGGETELDKKVIDQIGDPLMHLVRNAAGHGIESPKERAKRGKPAEGRVFLSAWHEGDRVVIEVADDGGGLDRDAIVKKAVERGMLSRQKAREITPQEIRELIFTPGFTTSREVTDVSGRGVGMDVVRQAVANLKGTLEVESSFGKGTAFRIRLPLTMAIIDALLVSVGGGSYAVAVSSVKEILEVEERSVNDVGGRECFRTNGRIIPLVRLAWALEGVQREDPGGRSGTQTTVVVDSGEGEAGLGVDRVVGQQEIVIKALPHRFEGVREISGGAVLGDGSICLILDVPSLVAKASEAAPSPARTAPTRERAGAGVGV